MRYIKLALFICILSLLFNFSNINAEIDYQGFENKIYSSPIDNNVFLIAPSDNDTLGTGFSYDLYLIDMIYNRTLYFKVNDTIFDKKEGTDKGIISTLAVNSTTFALTITTESNLTLIKVNYIARGGFTPLHKRDKDRIPRIPIEPKIFTFTQEAVMGIGIVSIMFLIWFLFLSGISIKHYKEHTTIENRLRFGRDNYKPPEINKDIKLKKERISNEVWGNLPIEKRKIYISELKEGKL